MCLSCIQPHSPVVMTGKHRTDLWISSSTPLSSSPGFLFNKNVPFFFFLNVSVFWPFLPQFLLFLKRNFRCWHFPLKRAGSFFVSQRSWCFWNYDQKVLPEILLFDGCLSSGREVGNSDKWWAAWLTDCWLSWKPPIFLVDFRWFFKSLG